MTSRPTRRSAAQALITVTAFMLLVAGVAACSSDNRSTSGTSTTSHSNVPTTAKSGALVGTIELTPGTCQGATVSGTSLRLVLPGGTVAKGPYFQNPDSLCDDKTYTVVSPGTDGGLTLGSYQPSPQPAFDAKGNSLAKAIIKPQAFSGIAFSFSSNPTDPQTKTKAPAPALAVTGRRVTGDLSSLTASWNNQFFNQGSPKPDGSSPGLTSPVSGTYDPATRAIVVEWTSQIVGGPFNDFTGVWRLRGTLRAAA